MISEAEYRKKVLACWYGKNIGGTLGGPYEGFPVVNHLTFYDPVPTGSMPNDDLELQAMYAAALDRMEKPCVSRETLADIWSKHMKFMCDEYAVAVRNLEMGLRPPWTGRFDTISPAEWARRSAVNCGRVSHPGIPDWRQSSRMKTPASTMTEPGSTPKFSTLL